MSSVVHRLDILLIAKIRERLIAGAFEHIAVESLGIPFAVYQNWLDLAEKPDASPLLRSLAANVKQGRAEARFHAEMDMRVHEPKVWLTQGPGKGGTAEQIWRPLPQTGEVQLAEMHITLFQLCELMLNALADMPEACALASEAVASSKLAQKAKPDSQ